MKHKRSLKAVESDDDYRAAKPVVDGEELDEKALARQVVSYFLLQGAVQCLAFIGPKPIISNDGKPGQLAPMFLLMLIQSFLMQHLTTEVMLAHITK